MQRPWQPHARYHLGQVGWNRRRRRPRITTSSGQRKSRVPTLQSRGLQTGGPCPGLRLSRQEQRRFGAFKGCQRTRRLVVNALGFFGNEACTGQ